MRKRKRKKTMGSKSIIYITMIGSLSLMGVGYGAWSNGISFNTEMKTGYIKRYINIENMAHNGLKYNLSTDGMTLNVSGTVYPDFTDEIVIEIEDKGSIPTVLSGIDEINASDITDFTEADKGGHNRRSLMNKDMSDKFQLSIDTKESDDSNFFGEMSTFYVEEDYSIQSSIDRVQEEIYYTRDEIDRLNNLRENHKFKYKLKFKQEL